jgi:hypothetical protein
MMTEKNLICRGRSALACLWRRWRVVDLMPAEREAGR